MTLEDFGDLAGSSQPHVISGRPIQPNHHVLDHGDLVGEYPRTPTVPFVQIVSGPVLRFGDAICR
jgi:hypothetical protein